MLTSEKPFASTPGNQIIYQVSSGKVHDLNSLREGKFKQIIRRCWRKDAESRPSFQELLLKFEQNVSKVPLEARNIIEVLRILEGCAVSSAS